MKKTLILLCCGLFIVFGLIFTNKASASGFLWKNIMKSTNILGVNILKADSMKLSIIQESDSTEDQLVILPEISSENNGVVYIFKCYIDNSSTLQGILQPYSGNLIDGEDQYLYMCGPNETSSVLMVADQDTNSWWVISNLN